MELELLPLFLTSVAAVLIGSGNAVTKTWNKDVNFYNADNWDRKRLPCSSDSAIIAEESTSLFLQVNGTLKELFLPMTGEIVLGNDVTVAFSDVPDKSCDGQDIIFTRKEPEPWLNPFNWDSDLPVPIPSDQVPCAFDNILFPPKKRFSVGIDNSVHASTISVGGEVLSTLQAASFLHSPDGQSQFAISAGASVSLSGLPCGDVTGCECGNTKEQVLNKICGYVRPCLEVSCPYPVNPVGACCPLCGAYLSLSYDEGTFRFDNIRARLQNNYNIGTGSGRKMKRETENVVVDLYMSKTDPGKVQVVLTDNGPGAENGLLASQVAKQISEDIENDPSAFGLLSSVVAASSPLTGDHGGFKMGAPTVVVVVVLVGVILVVSILYVMFKKQRLPLPMSFMSRKDEPLDADIEMPNIKYIEEVQPPEVTFDNPMYGKPIQYDDPTKDSNESDSSVEDIGSIGEEDGGFTNPMAIPTQ